jgi:medium-chain acyl-[acyl-carrier-protein] hydrolase
MSPTLRSLYLSYRPDPSARIRLFCFPNAGGGVSTLHNWLRGMPAGIHVCPIQLPGRENRRSEQPFTNLALLAPALADILMPEIEKPYAFFGHSLGAMMAFEVARELRRRGAPGLRRLFVAARKAPSLSDPVLNIRNMSEAQLIATVSSRFNAIPDAILEDRELLALFLPVLRADLEIIETYHYTEEPPLDCPISAFGGLGDASNPQSEIEQWKSFTTSTFSLRMYPGGHFFPRTSREELVAAIGQDLAPFTT